MTEHRERAKCTVHYVARQTRATPWGDVASACELAVANVPGRSVTMSFQCHSEPFAAFHDAARLFLVELELCRATDRTLTKTRAI